MPPSSEVPVIAMAPPSMSPMSRLPQEIVDNICKHLVDPYLARCEPIKWIEPVMNAWQVDLLKNVRLVNRKFAAGAQQLLFESVATSPRPVSVRRSEELSQSSMANCVKEVLVSNKTDEQDKHYDCCKLGCELATSLARFPNITTLHLGGHSRTNTQIWNSPYMQSLVAMLEQVRLEKLATISLGDHPLVDALNQSLLWSKDQNITDSVLQMNLSKVQHASMGNPHSDGTSKFRGEYEMWSEVIATMVQLKSLNAVDLELDDDQLPVTFNLGRNCPFDTPLKSMCLSFCNFESAHSVISAIYLSRGTAEHLKIFGGSRDVGDASAAIYRFLATECPRLISAQFDIERDYDDSDIDDDSTHGLVVMFSQVGRKHAGVCGDNKLKEFRSLFEQIDENRKQVGLDAIYHPLVRSDDWRDIGMSWEEMCMRGVRGFDGPYV